MLAEPFQFGLAVLLGLEPRLAIPLGLELALEVQPRLLDLVVVAAISLRQWSTTSLAVFVNLPRKPVRNLWTRFADSRRLLEERRDLGDVVVGGGAVLSGLALVASSTTRSFSIASAGAPEERIRLGF